MATIDASLMRFGTEIAPYVAALPYVEIDESTLRYTTVSWQGYGTVYEDGDPYDAQFTYYGRFSYSSEQALLNSTITGANLAGPDFGGFSIQGVRLQVREIMSNPSAAAAKMLQGSDVITGTSYDDRIDGYIGDDTIYGGAGIDQVIGGAGRNNLYGGAGADQFYLSNIGSGYWTTKPKAGDPVWYVQTKLLKGKKVTYSWVDRDYDIINDFSLADDTVNFKGDPNGYEYDVIAGGIALLVAGTTNVVAYFPGMTEDQYVTGMNEGSW